MFKYEATGEDEGLPRDVQVTLNYVKALDIGLQAVRPVGNTAITQLVDLGILRASKRRRNRISVADRVVTLLREGVD